MIDILIIEDSLEKFEAIKTTIKEINVNIGNKIQHAQSIIEAKIFLEKVLFDILVIDLVIPLRAGEEANPENCCQLLEEIETSPFLKSPLSIIGLTQYDDLNPKFSDFFEERLYYLLNYEKSSNEWKSRMKKAIFHLLKLKEDFLSPVEFRYKYDAAFVTALYTPEFQAVLKLSNDWTPINHSDDPSLYYETTITQDGKTKRILASFADQMGMVACTAICMKIMMKFKPQYIFLTGISAGVKKENVNYGDILVADLCWDYNSGKIVEFKVVDSDGEQTIPNIKFEAEPKSLSIKTSIKNRLLEFINNKDILYLIRKEWTGVSHNDLSAFMGPLATGSQVVASNQRINEIKMQNRKLIGIEMEAYGLYYACTQIFDSKITPIVIKSICDFGDETKNDLYQKYSAYTSVQFAKHFLFLYL